MRSFIFNFHSNLKFPLSSIFDDNSNFILEDILQMFPITLSFNRSSVFCEGIKSLIKSDDNNSHDPTSAGFTYRLDRLKPRASKVPYTVVLHLRILQNSKHPSSSLPLLKLIKHTPIFLQS
jgi:hypothetical protein